MSESECIPKTPYYVINKEKLDSLVSELKCALDTNWNNYIIGYSTKTNSHPWIMSYMMQNGCYAEVVSEDEFKYAGSLGYGKKIIYNGPTKSRESIINAAENGVIVNADAKREIRWLVNENKPYHVGIRVNFNLEKYLPGHTAYTEEGSRFGFCYENGELEKAINEIQNSKLVLSGLHLHCNSKTRSVEVYCAIADICCEIKEKYGLQLEYIDIGGGYFGGVDGAPSFNDYFKPVSDILSKHFDKDKTKLIVEPGTCLIAAPIDYVTSVIDVKDTSLGRFVVTDGSRTNIDPFFRKSAKGYFYRFECKSDKKIPGKQIICGFTCLENDRIFELDDALEFSEQDRIVYEKVGAYTMSLTPFFIRTHPRVYIKDNDDLYIAATSDEIARLFHYSLS